MEPKITVEGTNPPNSEQDKKIALASLRLLFWLSLVHGLWLTYRNLSPIMHSFSHPGEKSIMFLSVFIFALVLNFIPPLWASRLYKKGLYRKQLKVAIISFIVFQAILHFILAGISFVGGTLC